MLWLALQFPLLPLESLLPLSPPSEPTAIVDGGRIIVRNPCAHAQGIRAGMDLSAACALVPHLVYRERNCEIEALTLNQLATWAGQFTSAISLQPPTGIMLEIEGSLRLLGGLRAVVASIKRGCTAMGHALSLACAPTVSAAWLLARASSEKIIVERLAIRDAISSLPVAALDCDRRALNALSSIGIRSIGELLALPRGGVAQRFGQNLLDQLDRALGTLPEARAFFAVPPKFRATLEFPSAVANVEALLFGTKRLLIQLAGFLASRSGGTETFTVTLIHEDIAPTVREIRLAKPTRNLDRFVILAREHFASNALPAAVQQLTIEANDILELVGNSSDLFPDSVKGTGECYRLIEQLRARLGHDAVQGLSPLAEYRPEFSWKSTEPGTQMKDEGEPLRPLWLLEAPRRLREVASKPHYEDQPLTVIAGPEIIESGWWDGDVKRDYYVAQTPAYSTYWIFRERTHTGAWYLHGIFG